MTSLTSSGNYPHRPLPSPPLLLTIVMVPFGERKSSHTSVPLIRPIEELDSSKVCGGFISYNLGSINFGSLKLIPNVMSPDNNHIHNVYYFLSHKSHSCPQVPTWRQSPNFWAPWNIKVYCWSFKSNLDYLTQRDSWDLCCKLGIAFYSTQFSTQAPSLTSKNCCHVILET